MNHASISTATGYASAGDRKGLAVYLAGLLSQLEAAGATLGVIPAVTPHLCIDELTPISLPVIDITRWCRTLAQGASSRGSRYSGRAS
jgi:aspartate racemase